MREPGLSWTAAHQLNRLRVDGRIFSLFVRSWYSPIAWEKVARNGQCCQDSGYRGDLETRYYSISVRSQGFDVVSEATAPMDTGGREGSGQKAIETVDNLPEDSSFRLG